ncbi:fibropellin-3-like isoform X4 [Ruditapes philippinarum]|uniref:fibropellin-3-like isoform X4 n=1 Tax=Ruditapes philippinarum TaxID=129788 RepID=UPI00295A7660|nr:fibropellin-3-like isoform X4 [Ruditapes philippinarum]
MNCENDINECSSNPCKNGGICKDLVNEYECTCVAGYDGMNCENDINECLSNPCKHGSTCKDLVNKYECTCVAGYNGLNCNIDINECSSNPCKNGGTCKDLVNRYECTCVAGFDGINCKNNINECSPDPCKNGGTCKDLVNEYKCTCVAGYDGKNCDINVNDCSPNPCKNGATCQDLVNGYKCTCVAGYDGTDCENDINDCSPNPCQNGGLCKDLINGYECECVTGYNGPNCETEIKTTTKSPNQKLARASVTMIFPVQSNFNVTDPKLKDDVKNQLTTIYRDNMGETLKDLVIKSISKGSLVVDFELIYANDTSAASTKITEVNIALLSGGEIIKVLNETVSATSLKLNDVTVTNISLSDDKYICKMFEALSGMCPSNQHCSIVDRQPSCVLNEAEESTDLMLVIVVVVCAIAAPIIILLVICLTIRKLRNSNKLKHNNRTDKSHPGYKWSDHNFMGSYGNRLSGRSFKPDSYFPEHDYY